MTKPKDNLWWAICNELDLYGSNWPPQLARIFLVMADNAERVTEHVQDDTTMAQDVANWLRFEAQRAMEAESPTVTQTTAIAHAMDFSPEKKKKKKEKNLPLEQIDGVEKIQHIIDNFDFHKVQTTMKALKWKYYNVETGNYYAPSIEKLKDAARRVLCTAAFEEKSVASGGFFAQRYKGGNLHLMFYVEEETTFLYDVPPLPDLMKELERRNLIATDSH